MANRDIVKSAIADATRDLMRCETIDKISVSQICERANLRRRNFYRYFKDKFEVVEWINHHDFLRINSSADGGSIFDYMPHIASVLYSDRKYFINAFSYNGQNSFRECCIEYLREIIAPDYKGLFEDEATFEFFVNHVCNTSFDSFILWLSAEPCLPPEEFVYWFRELFYKTAQVTCRLVERPPLNDAGHNNGA